MATFLRSLPGAARLGRLMPLGSSLRTVLVLGAAALVLFLLALVFRIELSIELASLVLAAALVLVACGGLHLVRFATQPQQTVSVGYDVKLEQPLVPRVGRYSFRLEVFYEVEEKREHRRVDQGAIELRFRGNDHPELLAWCCERVRTTLERHRELAGERYPGARVLLAPEPTPTTLEAELAPREPELLAAQPA